MARNLPAKTVIVEMLRQVRNPGGRSNPLKRVVPVHVFLIVRLWRSEGLHRNLNVLVFAEVQLLQRSKDTVFVD